MKVLIATEKPFAKAAIDKMQEIIEAGGHEMVVLENGTKSDILDAIEDVDALIVRSDIIDGEIIDAANDLKVIVRAGAGYDNIDLDAATELGICVMNTPGQNSNAVAELVFGMLIFSSRNCYNGTVGSELAGKSIGLHAYGMVSKRVAHIAKGFDMHVYAYDPYVDDSIMIADGVTPVHTVNELYSTCNIVSLHIPATTKTKKSITKDLICSLPANGILINTARKEVIDEDGLMEALAERKDLHYLADVKPDCDMKLLDAYNNRVFFTRKKMGAQTNEANLKAGVAAANQVVNYLANPACNEFQVNR